MQQYFRAIYLISWLLLGLHPNALAVDKSTTLDTDGDGIVNACDADSDNDGIPDVWEDLSQNGIYNDDDVDGDALCIGLLGDGVSSYLDLDSDNDGLLDLFESGISLSLINTYDADHNGILSGAVGANGFLDALETFPDSGIPIYTIRNTDGDDKMDFFDLKSNGPDYDLYTVDPNLDQLGCGFITPINDPDRDGIQAVIDTDPTTRGATKSPLSPFTINYTMLPSQSSVNTPCPLPIRIVRFSGAQTENSVVLQWEIADASNFSHFEVERSVDLKQFESAGRVNFTEGQRFYQLVNERVKTGVMYYRLKLVDLDATFDYSKIIALRLNDLNANWQAGPNPTSGLLTLTDLPVGSRIELIDIQGKNSVLLGISSESTVQYEVSTRPAGIYLLKVTSPDGRTDTKRIVLQK